MDWFRAIYQGVYETLNLTNRYRYDHYWYKNDFFYEWEVLKYKMNLSDQRNFQTKVEILKKTLGKSFGILGNFKELS